jgi:hypothetical protein
MNPVRRLTAAVAALVTPLGLALVVAAPADAALTSPANGAVVAGTFTMSDSGVSDGSLCVNGTKPNVTLSLINSGGTTVFSQNIQSTSAVTSNPIDSHQFPNGAYTARAVEQKRSGTIICSNSSTTVNNAITITNTVAIGYSGANSAPQNTSTPITITLTDPANANAPVSGLSVTASLAGGGSASGTTNASGQATINLPVSGPPRTAAALTISTPGSAFWAANSVNRTFDVTKNTANVVLQPPATVVHGQAVGFEADLSALNGTGTPGGTVQFTLDGNNLGSPIGVVGGAAVFPATTSIATGVHSIGAIYSGDGNFFGGSATGRSLTINKADTTTALSDNPAPSTYGQATTFTATVSVTAPGAGNPTGGVQFDIDGQPFGTAVPLTGNTATLTISNLTAGNHNVTARYNGDPDFNLSDSNLVTHGVNRSDTNVALVSSDPTAVSGESLTYTATVTSVAPGQGVPPGQVQFQVDGTDLGGPVTLSAGGQAVSPATTMLVGTHHVTVDYLGTANYAGSNNAYQQAVTAASTTTTVTSGQNPSVFGQPVTFTATVAVDGPGSGTPTGVARFTVDGATAALVDLNNGSATATLSNLSVGDHDVVVTYASDDANFLPSHSADLTQTVNKAATSTALVSDAPTSVYGQPVTFTATVSVVAPGAGAPTGSVVFSDGSTVLGTVAISSATAFQATLTTAALSVGQHAISASYSGDGSFLASATSQTQVVQKASTSVVVTSSNNPSQSGQSTVFTAVVSPVAPGAGNPTGTVTFTVNGLPIGGARTVTGGVATSPAFSALTPGTYKVQAAYGGDGNFLKSTGLLDQGAGQSTGQGATTTSESATPTSAAYNATVTFTATVAAVAPATGTPSGVVQFWEGGVLLGSSSLAPASAANTATAVFTASTLQPGAHSVRAAYVGNYNFTGSQDTTSVSVGQAPTTTGVSSSANPIVYGDAVTLSATVSKALPASGTPTGSVTFREGSAVLGTSTLATVGGQQVASITVSGLHGGAHAITATYTGDTTFAGSTSPTFTQNVSAAPVTLVAGSPVAGAPLGTHNGYVRARLTDRYGNPIVGRTISFSNEPYGSRPAYHLCDGVTGSDGIAECDYTQVNVDVGLNGTDLMIDVNGNYDASFAGTADYQPATARGQLF